MKGKDNKFKIKTNAVNMPAGVFVFHTLATFFMGYEFCKFTALKTSENSNSYPVEEVAYGTRKAAEDILDKLQDACEDYGLVTVSDYYDMANVPVSYSDTKYGWTDMNGATISKHSDKFYINFPHLKRIMK